MDKTNKRTGSSVNGTSEFTEETAEETAGEFTRTTRGNDSGTPEKRGRGRPKLTEEEKQARAIARKAGKGTSRINFVSEEKRTVNTTTQSKNETISISQAQEIADQTIQFIEGFFVEILGDEARFKTHELMVLHTTLPKYLTTLSKNGGDTLIKYVFPIALLLVILMYGIRIINLWQEKIEQQNKLEQLKQEQEQYNKENDNSFTKSTKIEDTPELIIQENSKETFTNNTIDLLKYQTKI